MELLTHFWGYALFKCKALLSQYLSTILTSGSMLPKCLVVLVTDGCNCDVYLLDSQYFG